MTKPNKFDPTKLSILDVKIVEGAIKVPLDFISDSIDSFKTDMHFSIGFNMNEGMLQANIGFEIHTESNNDQEEAFGKFDFVYLFNVQNMEQLIILDDNQVIIDADYGLLNGVAATSYSTCRGILITRLQGTAIHEYILPIISPNEIIKKGSGK